MKIFVIISIIFTTTTFAHAQSETASTGYKDGFYFQTDDGNFLFKVGSRINTLYSYGKLENEPNVSSLDLAHAKLYFGGHAFNKTIQFYAQSAFAQNTRSKPLGLQNENTAFSLEDYYVRGIYGDVALQMGQFKVPFSKQYMIYSGNLQFATRSIASDAFQFGRDRGVLLTGKKTWLSYMLGFFNGGSQMTMPSISNLTNSQNISNDSNGQGLMYIARLSVFPQRPTGFSEGDVDFNEASRIEWGTSVALDQNRDFDTDFNQSLDEPKTNTLSVSSDFSYLRRGFSLQGEFYYRNNHFQSISDVHSIGFYAQTGYFIMPRSFEIAARYAWLDPNHNTGNDQSREISGVLNWYISNNHKHKMQWQYTNVHQDVASKNDHWFHWMVQLTI